MTQRVMLSYNRTDVDFVRDFNEKLEANGIHTWLDLKDIPPGFPWRQALYDGVLGSDIFIIFMTPEYVASEMCRMECFLAQINGKKILPLMIRDCWEELQNHQETNGLSEYNWMMYTNDLYKGRTIDNNERFAEVLKVIQGEVETIPERAVYISYKLNQQPFAMKVVNDLRDANIPVFIDTMMSIGDRWRDRLWGGVNNAYAIVTVLDLEASTSTYLQREVMVARTRQIPTFPLIVPEVANDENATRQLRIALDSTYEMRLLSETQWLLPKPDYETMLQQLITALRRTIELEDTDLAH